MSKNVMFRAWMPREAKWYRGGAVQLVAMIGNKFGLSEANGQIIELQQFTGLQDKNGVDIYEGDLLAFNFHQVPHEVVFDQGAFWAWDRYTTNRRELASAAAANPNCEVVANIYEVPVSL